MSPASDMLLELYRKIEELINEKYPGIEVTVHVKEATKLRTSYSSEGGTKLCFDFVLMNTLKGDRRHLSNFSYTKVTHEMRVDGAFALKELCNALAKKAKEQKPDVETNMAIERATEVIASLVRGGSDVEG